MARNSHFGREFGGALLQYLRLERPKTRFILNARARSAAMSHQAVLLRSAQYSKRLETLIGPALANDPSEVVPTVRDANAKLRWFDVAWRAFE